MNYCVTPLLALAFGIYPAYGRPPPNQIPDPKIAAWFQSLHRDSDNFPCCSAADCRAVDDYREADGTYVVTAKREDFVMDNVDAADWKQLYGDGNEAKIRVPNGNTTIRTDNPTGKAILCYSVRINQVFCFVPWDFKG